MGFVAITNTKWTKMIKIKNITLILLFSLIKYSSVSQNLSFSELLILSDNDIAEIEEKLTARNWEFMGAVPENGSIYGTVSFAFDKSRYDDSAVSFIQYMHSEPFKMLFIQTMDKQKYGQYLKSIKSLGSVLGHTETDNGALIKFYTNTDIQKAFKVEISTTYQNNRTVNNYKITIMSYVNYLLSFESKED